MVWDGTAQTIPTIHPIIFLYLRKAGPYRARRGAGTSIFGAYFYQKARIFTTYSTVPTSGTARRDPPRHGDLDAQILVKKGLM